VLPDSPGRPQCVRRVRGQARGHLPMFTQRYNLRKGKWARGSNSETAWISETSVSSHMTARRHDLEVGGRNVGILPYHYTESQRRRWRQRGPLKRRYPTTSLHGVTEQKMEAAWVAETSVSYHVTTWHHNSEDGGSMDLWNVGIQPYHYAMS
jgi:hypothetical protein